MSGINLDGDAAVVGGIHTDSHDVTNNVTTNNVHNSQNIYQAQKTVSEQRQDNEQQFLQAVCDRMADGILDDREMAELERLRLHWQISESVARSIIDKVRSSSALLNQENANNFLSAQLIEEVTQAIADNNIEVLQRKFGALSKLAATSLDGNVQYYFHLLQASLQPEIAIMSFIKASTDNYWQLFWVHVAYVKLGNVQSAEALLPRLGGFGVEQGNVALLMAIDNLWDFFRNPDTDYYRKQTEGYLNKAVEHGLSDALGPLWFATEDMLKGNKSTGQWKEFFAYQTLKGIKPAPVNKSASAIPTPPPMPKFNPQSVSLNQMQGFNPLQAVKNAGWGSNSAMPQMQSMPGSMTMACMPPMPGSSDTPPMHGQPANKAYISSPKSVDEPDEFKEHYGIIFTDTVALAQKYNTSREDIVAILADFFQRSDSRNMHWGLLDAADHYPELQTDSSWLGYNSLISDFVQTYGLPAGPDLHVMIIGGADVIPIPDIADPYEHGEGTIPTDTCYCFDGTFLPDLVDGGNFLLEVGNARNNVARLPLEDGLLTTSPGDDLGAYFNLSDYFAGGIPVESVVMSSNSEWLPASATMSQHLPLLCDANDPSLVSDRMYVSPGTLTGNDYAMQYYLKSISRAGMLMFNLHGADQPELSGFYSNDEAFNLSLLQRSSARVFNTVACYGARYKGGYTRSQSMLLSALYGGGVLLYTGSLIPVPMYMNGETDEVRELMLHPGTGSEVFMRLYPLYQFKGMTAGRALLQAKCDYFNMMRHVEQDGFSMSTALMFCLYGNPMLHVKKRDDVVAAARGNTSISVAQKSALMPMRKTMTQRIMSKERSKGSLLESMQGYVDSNLSAIRNIAEQYVYRALGLPPHCLESIDALSRETGDGNYDLSYSFNYIDPRTPFSRDKHVELDASGRVRRIYTTK